MADLAHDPTGIRKRPGMYIGDTRDGSGLHHMVWEVVANSLDQVLVGRCTAVDITILPDGAIAIEDDGPGIPLHDFDGVSFAEHALTTFHMSPTKDGHAPHTHIGRSGVGLFPVCALSSQLVLDVYANGTHFQQRFAKGRRTSSLERLGPTDRTGTRIAFLPDASVLAATRFDSGIISTRLRELAHLLPGLKIALVDQRQTVFHAPGGLETWIAEHFNLDPDVLAAPPFTVEYNDGDLVVEAAANWGTRHATSVQSFANVERTTEGGTHVRGFILGLIAGLRAAAPARAKGTTRDLKDVLSSGLGAVVCVRLSDPSYDGPTRNKLSTPRVRNVVKKAVAVQFEEFLKQQPAVLQGLVERVAG